MSDRRLFNMGAEEGHEKGKFTFGRILGINGEKVSVQTEFEGDNDNLADSLTVLGLIGLHNDRQQSTIYITDPESLDEFCPEDDED